MPLTITETAAKEIKRVMDEQDMNPEDYCLRVGVVGGGCSGFQYNLGFEKKDEGEPLNDNQIEMHGIVAKVDRKSDLYLEGTEIDFYTGLDKRGFVFNNPQATKSCGCGSSFSC